MHAIYFMTVDGVVVTYRWSDPEDAIAACPDAVVRGHRVVKVYREGRDGKNELVYGVQLADLNQQS
jgi:hypothetical protein